MIVNLKAVKYEGSVNINLKFSNPAKYEPKPNAS